MATTYNRAIRKLVVGFGNLFNNITLVRYNPDETEQQRFVVPIAYAGKEKYAQRLAFDPDLDKKAAMSLPRMSYEMTGLDYDASRKQNTNFKTFAKTCNYQLLLSPFTITGTVNTINVSLPFLPNNVFANNSTYFNCIYQEGSSAPIPAYALTVNGRF